MCLTKEFLFFGVNYLVELIPEIPHIFSKLGYRPDKPGKETDTLFYDMALRLVLQLGKEVMCLLSPFQNTNATKG